MRACAIEGCLKPVKTRGWCSKHYTRVQRYGTPDGGYFEHTDNVEEIFLRHVDKTETCWLWTSSRLPSGYGQFTFKRTSARAHRWSYGFYVGPIPAGLWVLHKCDNPPCVNPEHLYLGTPRDNTEDMQRKQRAPRYGNGVSGFVGVSKSFRGWEARIQVSRQSFRLGVYDTPERAALAYNQFLFDNQIQRPFNVIPGDIRWT